VDDVASSGHVHDDRVVLGRPACAALVGESVLGDRDRALGERIGERRPEVRRQVGQDDAILGASRSGDRRLDGREIEPDDVVEVGTVARLPPEALRLRVALDEIDELARTTCERR
jgi:hypothetical protein